MYVLVCVLAAVNNLEINDFTMHLQNHISGLSIKSDRWQISQDKLHVFEVILKQSLQMKKFETGLCSK